MKKIFIFFFLCFSVSEISFAQNYEWAKLISSDLDNAGVNICLDGRGNIYTITNDYCYYSCRVKVTKFDHDGNLIWQNGGYVDGTQILGGGLCIDKSGNVFIAGEVSGDLHIDGQILTHDGYNLYLLKFDSTGNYLWGKISSNTGIGSGCGLTCDISGNIFLTGGFSKSMAFDSYHISAPDSIITTERCFIIKFSNDGIPISSFVGQGSGQSLAGNICYSEGSLFVEGSSGNQTVLGNDTLINPSHPGSNANAFISSFDTSCNLQWAKFIYSNGHIGINAIKVNKEIFLTGRTDSPIITGADTIPLSNGCCRRIITAKLDSFGNLIWGKTYGGTDDIYGNGISVDQFGNSYFIGNLFGNSSIDGDSLTSNGSADILLISFDTMGNVNWVKNTGGNDWDAGIACAFDSSGNLFLTGGIRFDTYFDTIPLNAIDTLSAFIAKIPACNSSYLNATLGNLDTLYVESGSVTLDGSPQGGIYYGQGVIGNTFFPNISGDGNFVISYTIQDSIGCISTAQQTITVLDTSTTPNSVLSLKQKVISLSPNPAITEIKITNLSPTENQISIINLLGQQVKSIRVSHAQSTTIPVSDLPAGIYVVTILDGEKIVCKKLVKE